MLIADMFVAATVAIMCYVCGQTNLKPPGECTTQFQYDCSTLSAATSQRGSKLFCRTTRSKIGESKYIYYFSNSTNMCDKRIDTVTSLK